MADKFSDLVVKAVWTIRNELRKTGKPLKFEALLGGFMVRGDLNEREADEILDFQQLFNTLKEKGIIRPGKMEPLVEGLGKIGRGDLQKLLQDACDGIVGEEYQWRNLSQCFLDVEEHIGLKWPRLGRQLNLRQFDIDQIGVKHPKDLEEQIHAMLELWKERNGTKATKASLVAALRICEMNLAADKAEASLQSEKKRKY